MRLKTISGIAKCKSAGHSTTEVLISLNPYTLLFNHPLTSGCTLDLFRLDSSSFPPCQILQTTIEISSNFNDPRDCSLWCICPISEWSFELKGCENTIKPDFHDPRLQLQWSTFPYCEKRVFSKVAPDAPTNPSEYFCQDYMRVKAERSARRFRYNRDDQGIIYMTHLAPEWSNRKVILQMYKCRLRFSYWRYKVK